MDKFRCFLTLWLYLITLFVIYIIFEVRDINSTKLGVLKGYTYHLGTVKLPVGYAYDDEGEPIREYNFLAMEKIKENKND